MDAQPHDAHDPEPGSPLLQDTARSFVIRPNRSGWCLEDSHGAVGGLFTTLAAALAFGRSEQSRGRSIRIVVTSDDRRDRSPRAA